MRQNRNWDWLGEKKDTCYQKADHIIDNILWKVDLAHQFLYIVNDTLKKCDGCGSPFAIDGRDASLFFKAYDDESIHIGFVDGEICTLDSEFIYNRYIYFSKFLPEYHLMREKSEYYSWIYDMSLIKPFRKNKKPLCNVHFEDYPNKLYKECFRISFDKLDIKLRDIRIY